MNSSSGNGNGRRPSRNRRHKYQGKKGRKKSKKPCKFFNTPEGCRFGDKCWFTHSNIESKWWRKGEMPAPKVEEKICIPTREEVAGSFQQQLATLVNMPKRTRQGINTLACRVADLIRSYVPLALFHREISLSPLLGDLHNWPLLAVAVCPVTSRVYVGGQSTPLFVVDPRQDEPKPQWLCGASWPENGLPALSGGFNSAIITSVKVTPSGLVLFTIDCKAPLLGERPIEQDPRGIYAVILGKPIRLKFFNHNKPFRFDNIKEVAVSERGDRLYVLASHNFIYEFEFDENALDSPFHLLRKLDVGVKSVSIVVIPDNKLLLLSEKDIVVLDVEKFAFQRLSMKLHLLSQCQMKDSSQDCLLIHSDLHIRAVSHDTFLKSLKDGLLKERLQVETTALYEKDILIDLPLLGYDQRMQQIVTDTDARILSWFDVF